MPDRLVWLLTKFSSWLRDWTYPSHLSDARRDELAGLASEIMEKTSRAHRVIRLMTKPLPSLKDYSEAHIQYRKYEMSGEHDEEGVVFRYHYEQHKEELFLEFPELCIKTRTHFGDTAGKVMEDLETIIESVKNSILTINKFSLKSSTPTNPNIDMLVRRSKNYIHALCLRKFSDEKKFPGIRLSKAEKKRVKIFQNIPKRIDKALSRYVR